MVKVLRPGKIWSADDIRRYPEEFNLFFTEEQSAQLDAKAAALGISREDLVEQGLTDIGNQDTTEPPVASLVAVGLQYFQEATTQLAAVEASARQRQDTRLLDMVQRLQTGAAAMLDAYTDVALMISSEDDNQP